MSLVINGYEFPEECTALEGPTYLHVYLKNMSTSTKQFLERINDTGCAFCYSDDDEHYEYLNANIIYLGHNTIHVYDPITKEL